MAQDPLTPFLTRDPCEMAWGGGLQPHPDMWRHHKVSHTIEMAGLHALVRSAYLPREELLHMGFADADLDAPEPQVAAERAELLLGRIAWDAVLGDAGAAWQEGVRDRVAARLFGQDVIRRFFR